MKVKHEVAKLFTVNSKQYMGTYAFLLKLKLHAFNYAVITLDTLVYEVGTKTVVLRMNW